jgi:hypothetical protein
MSKINRTSPTLHNTKTANPITGTLVGEEKGRRCVWVVSWLDEWIEEIVIFF